MYKPGKNLLAILFAAGTLMFSSALPAKALEYKLSDESVEKTIIKQTFTKSDKRKKLDDFIKIISVEYIPKQGDRLPEITIGTKGYDKEFPEEVHYYVDGRYIFSWTPPRTFDSSGKRIGDYEWDSIKFRSVCLPHEKGRSIPSYENLKEGRHTLKAILEDVEGNKVEDTYTFEVK